MAMHCQSCLDGNHLSCCIYTPAAWEGGGGRCVCACRKRVNSSLTEKERISTGEKVPGVRKPVAKTRAPRVVRERIAPGATKWTDDRLRQLVQLKAQGLTSRQIGVEVGAHMDIVRTYLSRAAKKGITA